MRKFIGIDPGKEGAIACLEGEITHIFQTPVIKVGNKKHYDIQAMHTILNYVKGDDMIAAIELVHSMPGQGVTAMFSMGEGLGLWKGLVVGMGIPYEMVTPQRWKKALLDGMPKEKGSSVLVAKRLFPNVEMPFKKDHNKADALLLAEYIKRKHGGQIGL